MNTQVNDTVYLVVTGEPHPYYGKCCTFRRPWHVFRPWVTSPMHYSHVAPLNGSAADWWEFKYQDVQPFMWGFYRDRTAGYISIATARLLRATRSILYSYSEL